MKEMMRPSPIEPDLDDDELQVIDDEPTIPGLALGARILVAEDDAEMLTLVTTILSGEGYQVRPAFSGTSALRVLGALTVGSWSSGGVDLLILDMCMPGMNGLEVLEQLRSVGWTTPAILMTAFAGSEVVAHANRLDAVVLSKPFPLDTLTQTACALLVPGNDVTVPGLPHYFRLD